ncbi:MAG: PDZ domain-containing protein [bacterium]
MKHARLFVLPVLLVMLTGFVWAEDQGFLRYPDVHGDKVVFTSEGDLWIAPVKGGTATRMTIHDGEESYAKFSADGKWIAYSGEYDGNQDVYLIPVSGGEPKRLTFHGSGEGVVGWSRDNRIMYRCRYNSGQYDYDIYTVSPEGGYPQKIELPRAALASFEPKGTRIAYQEIFRNNATWKHYKGGLADRIWVADLEKGKYGKKPISTYDGHNSYPMWIGERIYFLSDSTGRKNIWSMLPDGSDQKQHTFHKKWDARWPSDGGNVIVYQHKMDLWKFDTRSGDYAQIHIQLPSERLRTRDRNIDPSGYITGFDLNEDGKWLAISSRGQLFVAPTKSRETLIRRITPDFKSRAKSPLFVDKKLYAITDRSGEDEFWAYDPFLKEDAQQISKGNKMWRYEAQVSPDKKSIAYSDGDLILWIMDVETGKSKKVAQSEWWELRDFAWSPDSRYLAYADNVNQTIHQIHIYDTEIKKDHVITDPWYSCYLPTWDPDGKYLYYLNESNFDPMRGSYGSQFVYPEPDKLYMVLLADTTRSPFAADTTLLWSPEPEEEDEEKDEEKEDKDDEEKEDDEEEELVVTIDWEGLENRVIELPVEAGLYFGLKAVEGALYYMSHPPGDYETSLNIFVIEDRESSTVMSGIDNYDVSDDNKVVVVLQGGSFIRMDAGATDAPSGTGDDDPAVKLNGWFVKLNPQQEWKQMLHEAWRIQRDFFYDEKMHGLDWPAVYDHYKGLVDRLSTRSELNDLIGEMIAEMNIGHAYVFGGDLYQPEHISVGLLGADVSRDDATGYFKLDKIYAPDLSFEDWNSPLVKSGVDAKAGDYIIAIDDIPCNTVNDYLELMQNKANKDVILTLNREPTAEGARDVIVKPISSEYEMRYWDWVQDRRAYVEKKTGGKVGYMHMSDMGYDGLWQFGHEYYAQYHKKAMILDVRYNGGGNIADMLLSQLNRKMWAVGRGRHGGTGPTPPAAFYGHYAILCNAETGSDGETFTQGAKLLDLGPVFGKRTWGGWVGIRSDKPLNDDVWYTTPEFSGWGAIGEEKGKWLIEGPGVYPDYDIEQDPGSVLKGEDPQMDAALDYLLKKLREDPMEYEDEPKIPKKKVNFPK